MKKTIFTSKDRPYIGRNGDLFIPKNIKAPGACNPPLMTQEWFYLLMLETKGATEKDFKFIGVPSTLWRIKKRLQKMGYL